MTQVHVTLNPDGVAAPALRSIQNTIQVVKFCLAAIDEGDIVAPPAAIGTGMQVSFSSDPRTTDERRQAYRNWVLTKAFGELARGVRESLEEAYNYIEVARLSGTVTTGGALQERLATFKEEANKARFPALLEHVGAALKEKLHFEEEFRILNRVRNCLEHRNGIVGQGDIVGSSGALVLALPRFKCFYLRDGQEVELRVGDAFEKGTEISIKRVTDELMYGLGDRIVFSADDIQALGMSCWLFVHDLAAKLPRPYTAAAA